MVEVLDPYAHALEICGKILRHFLCKGGDKHTFVLFRPDVYFAEQVFYLTRNGLDDYLGVNKTCGTYYLLHYLGGFFTLDRSGSGGNVYCLIYL